MTVKPTRILNKVLTGAIGAGIGPALVVILVWLLSRAGVQLPDNVQNALNSIVGAVLAALAAYYTPLAPGEVQIAGEMPPVAVQTPSVVVNEVSE